MTRIVAVDDDVDTRELFRDLLVGAGYDITTCSDSATAMDCIRTVQPDAIILDLRLETPDAGLAVLRTLKGDATLQGMPVIVCTADVHGVRRHADELERHDVALLLKPFDIDALLALLRHVLGGSGR